MTHKTNKTEKRNDFLCTLLSMFGITFQNRKRIYIPVENNRPRKK